MVITEDIKSLKADFLLAQKSTRISVVTGVRASKERANALIGGITAPDHHDSIEETVSFGN